MRHTSISFRISLIVTIAILSGIVISGVQIWSLRQTLYAEREHKLRDMVDGALKLIESFDEKAKDGTLPLDKAQTDAKAAIRALRWGNGEYYGVYQTDGVTLVHANPKFEGVNRLDARDPNGTLIVAKLIDTAQKGGGLVRYMVPRGTNDANQTPMSKMAYAAPYPAWNWVIQTGVYIDDINDALWRQFLLIGSAELIVLLITGALAVQIARSVTRPVKNLVDAIGAIDPAHPGQWTCPPVTKDELGQIIVSVDGLTHAFQSVLEQRDQAQNENARLGAELDVSRRMQQILLPSSAELVATDGLDIAAYMEPATEVGGDYYDILRHAGGVRIGIGDVTGHGLESGMIMLMTQCAMRTLLTSKRDDLVGEINIINTTLYENIRRMGCGKNLSLALLDYKAPPADLNGAKGALTISGQHEYVIIARQDGRLETIDTENLGFPIGLVEDIAAFVDHMTMPLYCGDVVILYTDGITEAASEDNRLYGLDKLAHIAIESRSGSAEAIKDAIIADVKRHMGNAVLYDDLTLVVLKQL